jgi:hypothetical protein
MVLSQAAENMIEIMLTKGIYDGGISGDTKRLSIEL